MVIEMSFLGGRLWHRVYFMGYYWTPFGLTLVEGTEVSICRSEASMTISLDSQKLEWPWRVLGSKLGWDGQPKLQDQPVIKCGCLGSCMTLAGMAFCTWDNCWKGWWPKAGCELHSQGNKFVTEGTMSQFQPQWPLSTKSISGKGTVSSMTPHPHY